MSDAGRLVRCGGTTTGADGAVWIVFGPEHGEPGTGANACGGGCGACPVAMRPRRLAFRSLYADADGAPAVRPGDPVELSVDAAGLVRTAGRVFGVPLGGLLAGAWIGGEVMGEGASIAFGMAGLGVGLIWLLRRGRALVPLLGLRVGYPVGGRASERGGR